MEAQNKSLFSGRGTKVGKWELGEIIGGGGYGRIYRGFKNGTYAAIKILDCNAQTATATNGFENEIQILKTLNIQGIPRVKDEGKFNNHRWFAMSYLSNCKTIDVYCANKNLTIKLNSILEVSKVLSNLHSRNITHRDLSTSNILVDNNNEVYIVDFGLAQLTNKKIIQKKCGTLEYLPPERFYEGNVKCNQKGDIASLGYIAYEILTKKKPVDLKNLTIKESWYKIKKRNKIPGLLEKNKNVSRKLKKLIRKMTSKHINKRPTSEYVIKELKKLTS